MTYVFTHEDKKERERLATIEANLDPFTIESLQKIGVAEGWRCLEIGAGGGSISEWLCDRVGPSGKVVATDLQTKFLEAIEAPNLEVRKHDITTDELENESFDLVTARKVLEHLPEPEASLRRTHRAFQKYLSLEKNKADAQNNLAWSLITAPDPGLHDVPWAIELRLFRPIRTCTGRLPC